MADGKDPLGRPAGAGCWPPASADAGSGRGGGVYFAGASPGSSGSVAVLMFPCGYGIPLVSGKGEEASAVHELSVTRSILGIVLRHAEAQGVTRVQAIDLSVGALSDLEPEWLQKYFDHLSRGTLAEGAVLRVSHSPMIFLCEPCAQEYSATRDTLDTASCPKCGSREGALVSGAGYMVESMEVQ